MTRWTCLWICLTLVPLSARADLRPEEVGVIASGQGRQSRDLAVYYMKLRGIPEDNLYLLEAPAGELLSRNAWEARVRPALHNWMLQGDRRYRLRCLVTLWDVPLKVGPSNAKGPGVAEHLAFLTREKAARRVDLGRLAAEFMQVANADPVEPPTVPDSAEGEQLAKLLDAPFQEAVSRVRKLEAEGRDPVQTKRARQKIDRLFMSGTGLVGSIRSLEAQLNQKPNSAAELRHAMDVRRGELNGLRAGINHLSFLPEGLGRDLELMSSLQQSDGLLGAYLWVNQHLDLVSKNETHASLDSELALILWPEHALHRWIPNPRLRQRLKTEPSVQPPVMMVSRIDGPTFEICRGIVDASVAVEKTGLTGKVYIDGRGLRPKNEPGTYGDYDQTLRELAAILRDKTKLEVIYDDKEGLFQPGDCPDAALYCGWYSLRNYVDAFTWRPGAVGYHMASGEMGTLRGAKSNVWCKRMLETGVVATLGPTFEPYLAAFPRPNEFFPLLLTGKLTLAEVYAATCPFQSWTMTLIGDPLYNPFKNNPQLAVDDLPDALKVLVED